MSFVILWNIRKMDPIKDHVTSNGEAYIISGDVVEIVKNHPCAKALNKVYFRLHWNALQTIPGWT